jgi:hypothetical protein
LDEWSEFEDALTKKFIQSMPGESSEDKLIASVAWLRLLMYYSTIVVKEHAKNFDASLDALDVCLKTINEWKSPDE